MVVLINVKTIHIFGTGVWPRCHWSVCFQYTENYSIESIKATENDLNAHA